MADLRSICIEIECQGVQTYIQSGNVVFVSSASASVLEKRLEQVIEKEFHFAIPVLVRSAPMWQRYIEGNPFPGESEEAGNRVLLCLSKLPPTSNSVAELRQHATQEERVAEAEEAIWIYYANGIARSKLTPAVLDRHVGSSVTARNWRTVLKLNEMARAVEVS